MKLLLRQTHTEFALQGVPLARLHLTKPSCTSLKKSMQIPRIKKLEETYQGTYSGRKHVSVVTDAETVLW